MAVNNVGSARPGHAALVRRGGGAVDVLQRAHRQLVQRTVGAPVGGVHTDAR